MSGFQDQVTYLASRGNKPEEWRQYIENVMSRALQQQEESKQKRVAEALYGKALKVIPTETNTVDYAALLISYAEFKSKYDVAEAEKILKHTRRTLGRYAIVHVACAELELRRDNKDKAVRILQSSLKTVSSNTGILELALQRAKDGILPLLGEVTKENIHGLELNPDSGASCDLRERTGDSSSPYDLIKPNRPGTQEVQRCLDSIQLSHQSQHRTSSYNHCDDHNDNLKQTHDENEHPHKHQSRERNVNQPKQMTDGRSVSPSPLSCNSSTPTDASVKTPSPPPVVRRFRESFQHGQHNTLKGCVSSSPDDKLEKSLSSGRETQEVQQCRGSIHQHQDEQSHSHDNGCHSQRIPLSDRSQERNLHRPNIHSNVSCPDINTQSVLSSGISSNKARSDKLPVGSIENIYNQRCQPMVSNASDCKHVPVINTCPGVKEFSSSHLVTKMEKSASAVVMSSSQLPNTDNSQVGSHHKTLTDERSGSPDPLSCNSSIATDASLKTPSPPPLVRRYLESHHRRQPSVAKPNIAGNQKLSLEISRPHSNDISRSYSNLFPINVHQADHQTPANVKRDTTNEFHQPYSSNNQKRTGSTLRHHKSTAIMQGLSASRHRRTVEESIRKQLGPPLRVKATCRSLWDSGVESTSDITLNAAEFEVLGEKAKQAEEQSHQRSSLQQEISSSSSTVHKEISIERQEPPMPAQTPAPIPVSIPSASRETQSNTVVPAPVPVPAATPAKFENGNKTLCVNGRPYMVLRTVGRGGSAKVYQVFDLSTNRICALKKVDLSSVSRTIKEGYMNETELLKKLQKCDRVIKLFDSEYNESSEKMFLVLEFGHTDLNTVIVGQTNKDKQLKPITVRFYFLEMVTAVNAMHKQGVIHVDLKPANFVLVNDKVKLIDFGIANAVQQDKTSILKETAVGTPSYMSPEMLVANTIGPTDKPLYKIGKRSDVWSLGCILYQMVYGHTPFQHIHSIRKIDAITNPNYPIEFPERNDPELMDVLKKCLQRDVQLRPTTDELLQHPYLCTSWEKS